MAIYVCESGVRYEGGYSFYASTSYVKAWKALREERIRAFNNRPKAKGRSPNEMRLVDRDYWQCDYDYLMIRRFTDD